MKGEIRTNRFRQKINVNELAKQNEGKQYEK